MTRSARVRRCCAADRWLLAIGVWASGEGTLTHAWRDFGLNACLCRRGSSSKSLSTTHTDTIHLISGGVSEKIGNHFTSGFFGSSFYPTNDLSLDTLNLGKLWQLQNNTFHPTWGRMSLSSVVAHTLITQRNLRALCQLLSPSCN
uniref:(northern house mosquito) hypothetical protein n=1 Tax=Culex pipiens TaxID=7175 RepID=A0A8D7ZVP5_CULPI